MKRVLVVAVAALAGVSACSDSVTAPDPAPNPSTTPAPELSLAFGGTARVTNANDAGPGSFRQAVLDANANSGIKRIELVIGSRTIALHQPVVYTGAQSLSIEGIRVTLDGSALPAGAGAFVANGGGDLAITGLTVRGAPGAGITVAVPSGATGTQKVSLLAVTAADNGGQGILINDQAEFFTDPNSTSSAGSDASLEVLMIGCAITGNGFGAIDEDGVRINEGGAGTLKATISATRVEGNGGDGIEFDERGPGDVQFNVFGTTLARNGSFSAEDFDDGIDIDEADDGSVMGTFALTSANENFEQGFDLNENGVGDMRVDMTLVEAIGNHEEGIEYEEDDDVAGGGDIVATLVGIKTRGNGAADGDAGLKLREKGAGNLNAKLIGIESSGNFVDGILLREDADGNLTANLQNVVANDNTGDGIEFDENSTGNFDGVVEKATTSNNTQAGVRADQGGAGAGTLHLTGVTANANGVAALVTNAGIVVTQTP